MHAFDRQKDIRTYGRTELLSLDRVCILCSAVKIAGHQLGRRFFVEVTRRGHQVEDNSETLFCKTTQACGCPQD